MTLNELVALTSVAAVAGAVNAVAGGGTLLTFPTLLLHGVTPIVANATSTLALVIGTAGSLAAYRRQLVSIKHWLIWFVPVSAVGGWIGSWLLTRSGDKVFARLVPFLILFATLLFLSQSMFRRLVGVEDQVRSQIQRSKIWGAVFFQFAVSVYGGYFGAGIGILMLASLGILGLRDIHEMNALKTVLASLINIVAAVWFVAKGLIDWPKAGVMTLGALAGYYLGAHFSQRIPQKHVRRIITAIGFGISALMFYRQFGPH